MWCSSCKGSAGETNGLVAEALPDSARPAEAIYMQSARVHGHEPHTFGMRLREEGH